LPLIHGEPIPIFGLTQRSPPSTQRVFHGDPGPEDE